MADHTDEHGFPQPQDDFGINNPFASPMAVESAGHGQVTRSGEPLNPWISMWTRPREVVRQQLETDPTQHVLLLAILAGIAGNLDNAVSPADEIAYRLGTLAGAVVAGAISGIIVLFVLGWLLGVTGRWLGGVAYAKEVRTAWAWAYVPYVWLLPISFAVALAQAVMGTRAFYGERFVDASQTGTFSFDMFPVWLYPLMLAGMVIFVWKTVISCMALGEAHQFSGWRGFGALVLAMLVLMGVAFAIAIPLFMLIGMSVGGNF